MNGTEGRNTENMEPHNTHPPTTERDKPNNHLRVSVYETVGEGDMKGESKARPVILSSEAVKITGGPYVPAGQVAFRAKTRTKYQLPHRGIIAEEFGIARYCLVL
ncbi:protein executer 1, chloroplastic [Tanacetum coccineum]